MKIDKSKYDGLLISRPALEIMNTRPLEFKRCCNGVGSTIGFWSKLLWYLTPNTVWGLNITCCSDLHDVDYNHPQIFESVEKALQWKEESDNRFYKNLKTHIKRNTKNRWLLYLRLKRARKYYYAVKNFGETSFLADKTISGLT